MPPATITKPIINRAAPIRPPSPRSMDITPPEAQSSIEQLKNKFFGTHANDLDTQISIKSPLGFFRIFSYINPGNPNDRQYVVFFYNTLSKETFEIHGTLAIFFIQRNRNKDGVTEFPIDSDHASRKNKLDVISFLSLYTLNWEAATNKVTLINYKNFVPEKEATIIIYGEEYNTIWNNIIVKNWKNFPEAPFKTVKYQNSRSLRQPGAPTQILLHETAGFSNIVTPAEQDTYFAIPHFAVNNPGSDGKGNIVQFADVAENVPHGETLNERSVGIEFVNAPQEEFYDKDFMGHKKGDKKFNLDKSDKGIYLATKIPGYSKVFIPMEFSDKADKGFFELTISEGKLVNLATLKAGIGKEKKKIIEEKDKKIFIRYAQSENFEHLASLVKWLADDGAVKQILSLADAYFWKFIVQQNGKEAYIYENGFRKQKDGSTHFFMEIREPGLFYHMFIGGHRDGAPQGLYLYLKFVKKLGRQAIIQTMIDMMTSDLTDIEKSGIKLKSKVVSVKRTLSDATKPVEVTFKNILEIPQIEFVKQETEQDK